MPRPGLVYLLRRQKARLLRAFRALARPRFELDRSDALDAADKTWRIHWRVQEEVVHPFVLENARMENERARVEDARELARLIEDVLASCRGLEPSAPEWAAKARVVERLILLHAEALEALVLRLAVVATRKENQERGGQAAHRLAELERNYEIEFGSRLETPGPSGLRATFARRLLRSRAAPWFPRP